MKLTKRLTRAIAIALSFLMAFTSIDFTSMAYGPGLQYGGPNFGLIAEDFDYNRAKMLGQDKVFALNHNQYQAFRSFNSVSFTEYTNPNGPYFEFSYPYNCEADITVYKLDTLLNNTTIYEGGYPAQPELLTEENKMGTVKGILLKNPQGLSQAQVEQRLQFMAGPAEELKAVQIYGNSGKNARYYTLEDYYALMGIPEEETTEETVSEMESEESVEESETESETETETETEPESMEGETSTEEESSVEETSVEESSEEESGADSVSDNAVAKVVTYQNPVYLTETPEPEVTILDAPTVSQNQVPETIPEDFYILDDTSFAEENSIALMALELPKNITHNYLRWDGTYITKEGAEEKLPETPGSYLLVIEPSEGSKALEKKVSILPFNVGIAGGSEGSGSEEEVANLFRKMFADHSAFRLTAFLKSQDPVDLATGSLLWEYTDLKLEGSQTLEFTRFYDSAQAEEKMALGCGWSHNFDYGLDTFYGTVMIRMPHGYTHEFVRDYDGTYVTAPGSSYSLESGDGIYVLKNTDGTRITFNEAGILTEIRDIRDRVTTFENDGTHITKASNKAGSIQFTYSGDLLSGITDSAGRSVAFSYAGDDLTGASNPDGDSMSFTYDGSHNLLTMTGFTGEVLQTNSYNEKHQVVHQQIPDLGGFDYSYNEETGTTTLTTEAGLSQTVQYDDKFRIVSDSNNAGTYHYTYDDYSRRTSETDRNGNTVTYEYAGDTTNVSVVHYPDGTSEAFTYNEKNQITSKTCQDGSLLQYSYDEKGNLTSETDGRGGVTSYTYDGDSNCTSRTDAKGLTTSYTYDGNGRRLSETDPLGATTFYEYDSVGRKTKKISPLGQETVYTYTPGGKLASETDAMGSTMTYEYTANGMATKHTDKNGNSLTASYSALNKLLTVTDREGNTTVYTVDKSGNTASVTDAEGNITAYGYDGLGRNISLTDGNGNVTTFGYDANDNVIESVTPEGNKTTNRYDSMNRMTATTDARGAEVSYQYDSMGRLKAVTDAQGYTTSYSYDANGNLLSVTNGRGYTTSYAYDEADRLIQMTDALGGQTSYGYDDAGRMITLVRPDGTTLQNSYDAAGNMSAAADALGNTSTYTYDGNGLTTSQTDAREKTERYTYDANGNLLTSADALGNTTSYSYDKENRMVKQTDAAGNTSSYSYYKNGWLKEETDASGAETLYAYDKAGNVVKITDPEGYEQHFTYDKDNRVTTVTDKNGNETVYTYDGNGNILTCTNPDTGVESFGYDNNNRVISYTDAEGYTTHYEYDGNGNLITITDAKGNVTRAEYDALDRQTVTTDAAGNTVILTLDSMGRISKAVNEDGAETVYTYDAAGRVTKIQDALGHEKTYTYDANGNVLTETDENGVTRSFEYNALNKVTVYTDGLGNTMKYRYDKLGRVTGVTDRNGNETVYTYDAVGRVLAETDGLGNTKRFTYNKNGQIIAVTDKRGNTVSYELDGNGNILTQTDEAGHKSYFEYDSMNRLVKTKLYSSEKAGENGERIMDGEQITLYTYDHRGLKTTEVNARGDSCIYVYDGLGSCIQKTDEDGYVTSYEYDALNRLAGTDYNGSKKASYVYNGTGALIEMTDWNGVTAFTYDALNRLTKVTDFNNHTTVYEYDNVGNQTALIYPNGAKATYAYDAQNRQTSIKDSAGQEFLFTYDANGNQLSKKFDNGEMERYQYDANNQRIRMDEYTMEGVQKTYTVYTYDENGNRTSDCNRVPTTPVRDWTETGNTGTWGGKWNLYTYDSCNRLVKEYEQDTALSILYGYDFLGNKTYEKNSQDVKRYTYNELNQLVTKEAYNRTTNYEYDKRGNRILETSINTQENRRTFVWDETNHLVSGTRGPDYGLYTSTYIYNGLGKRVNSTIMGPDKTIYDRDYVLDYTSPEYNDLVEYNEGHYQWQGDKPVHELYHLYSASGERIQVSTKRFSQWGGEDILYKRNVHEDIMGSAVYYTQQDTGYIKNKHEYTTWGNNTKAPTYNYDPEYRSTEPYYTGHPYDGSLNLYYAETRFYDPETGSWLSKDPAGIEGGLNLYQYCRSNPTSYLDVTGESGLVIAEIAKLVVGAVAAVVTVWVVWDVVLPNIQEQVSGTATYNPNISSFPVAEEWLTNAIWGIPALRPLSNAFRGMECTESKQKTESGEEGENEAGEETKDIPSVDVEDLPENAQEAYNKYAQAGWKGNVSGQTKGTHAGGEYNNKNDKLPRTDSDGNKITYREWDVNNKQPGMGRDGERFVTGSDGSKYYTDSHYGEGTSPTGLPPFVQIN